MFCVLGPKKDTEFKKACLFERPPIVEHSHTELHTLDLRLSLQDLDRPKNSVLIPTQRNMSSILYWFKDDNVNFIRRCSLNIPIAPWFRASNLVTSWWNHPKERTYAVVWYNYLSKRTVKRTFGSKEEALVVLGYAKAKKWPVAIFKDGSSY